MSTAAANDAEEIVCDTSFVSVLQRAAKSKEVIESWPPETKDRLERAILGISVISLAELRSGYAVDNWGENRVAQAEAAIAAYLWFPLDLDVVEKCAALRAASKNASWGVGDNDLWIAATAQSRGCPVVSCDTGFCRIEGIDLIYLPSKIDAPATCDDVG